MSLHALIAEMRERAALQPYNDMALLAIRWADKLEAALAVGGEAAAWMDHMGGVITAAMKAADPGRPYNTPLFTHPAGAVQVTDEMVSRAICVMFGVDDASTVSAQEHEIMRETLNAALNPGGSRE